MRYNLIFKGDEDIRIDQYISKALNISRRIVKTLFDDEKVTVNNALIKPSYKLQPNDSITLYYQEEVLSIVPTNLSLDIIYEDDDLLIVNKPKGLTVHPSPSDTSISLVHGLMYHTDKLSSLGGDERRGIVHRLDKDTSGLLVVAKTDIAHERLVSQFKERNVKRIYECVVVGNIKEDSGTISAPILRDPITKVKMATDPHGKVAITHFTVLNRTNDYTHLTCSLETGRTHQIRVHLSYIGYPLLGDFLYGNKKQKLIKTGQVLHAKTIGFIHPITNLYMEFTSELPLEFKKVLEELNLS